MSRKRSCGATAMRDLKRQINPDPDKDFLFLGDQGISFAGMNRLASGGCGVIQRFKPLRPGDKVGILMANGLPFVGSLLALMRMGMVAVPLNTRLTKPELKWQVDNADCQLVLCDPSTVAQAHGLGVAALELRQQSFIEPPSAYDEFGWMNLADDFAIVHTSGTSGRPKAALLTYRNIFSNALGSSLKLENRPSDRWLCVLPLYHLGGMSILLRSLIYGSAIDLMPAAPFDVDQVNQKLSDRPITLVSLVPTMLQRLLDAKTRPWNPYLRLILLGGEAPSPRLLQRCIADEIPMATSYGLTETASQVATALPELVYRKPGTVGKPLTVTQVRIIDEQGEDAAPNIAGEILVKGDSVMRGYFNDPAATARALRDGWLHTGDIGYRDEDGDLFILQRRSDLIVSGGENIYPAEVESVLRAHPAVEEAVVVGVDDADWGQRAAAAVALKPEHQISAEALIAFARARIAGYKIPREIRIVDALPRTASGKIKRGDVRGLFDE